MFFLTSQHTEVNEIPIKTYWIIHPSRNLSTWNTIPPPQITIILAFFTNKSKHLVKNINKNQLLLSFNNKFDKIINLIPSLFVMGPSLNASFSLNNSITSDKNRFWELNLIRIHMYKIVLSQSLNICQDALYSNIGKIMTQHIQITRSENTWGWNQTVGGAEINIINKITVALTKQWVKTIIWGYEGLNYKYKSKKLFQFSSLRNNKTSLSLTFSIFHLSNTAIWCQMLCR